MTTECDRVFIGERAVAFGVGKESDRLLAVGKEGDRGSVLRGAIVFEVGDRAIGCLEGDSWSG